MEGEGGKGHRQVVSQFRQPELSGKKGQRGGGGIGRIERPARALAVIKISADSGLMHEMMAAAIAIAAAI